MPNQKDDLKERVDQRTKEAEDIKKVHEELQALRALHKKENAKFAEERSHLAGKDKPPRSP